MAIFDLKDGHFSHAYIPLHYEVGQRILSETTPAGLSLAPQLCRFGYRATARLRQLPPCRRCPYPPASCLDTVTLMPAKPLFATSIAQDRQAEAIELLLATSRNS